MQKYFEINKDKQNIRCKLYSDKNEPIKKVVLYGHGFAGHKDNKAAEKFAERVLTKYKGIALITFNLPSHGDDVKKKIVLDDCMNYIEIVLDYIRTTLNVAEIYSYATSFGGYLVLRYIKERGNPFKKIVLRSPAINIYESMVSTILGSDELEKIQKGKIVSVGFDRKVQIDQKFLDDLKSAEIRNDDYLEFAEDILILHGTKDELVSFDVSRDFAENNIIEFVPVEGADHRFQNPICMETAIKKILEFFSIL